MVIMPAHRGDISIERMMPAAAGKFFYEQAHESYAKRSGTKRSADEATDGTAKDCHREEKDYDEKARTPKAVATKNPTVEEASKSGSRTRRDEVKCLTLTLQS